MTSVARQFYSESKGSMRRSGKFRSFENVMGYGTSGTKWKQQKSPFVDIETLETMWKFSKVEKKFNIEYRTQHSVKSSWELFWVRNTFISCWISCNYFPTGRNIRNGKLFHSNKIINLFSVGGNLRLCCTNQMKISIFNSILTKVLITELKYKQFKLHCEIYAPILVMMFNLALICLISSYFLCQTFVGW